MSSSVRARIRCSAAASKTANAPRPGVSWCDVGAGRASGSALVAMAIAAAVVAVAVVVAAGDGGGGGGDGDGGVGGRQPAAELLGTSFGGNPQRRGSGHTTQELACFGESRTKAAVRATSVSMFQNGTPSPSWGYTARVAVRASFVVILLPSLCWPSSTPTHIWHSDEFGRRMFASTVPKRPTNIQSSLPRPEIQDLPGTAPLPIPTRHASAKVGGFDTHVVCQLFTDRLVVLISQVGKIGTLVGFVSSPPPSLPSLGSARWTAHRFPANIVVPWTESQLQASLADRAAPGLGEERVIAMLSEAAMGDIEDGMDDDPDTPRTAELDTRTTNTCPDEGTTSTSVDTLLTGWLPPPLVPAANARHIVLAGTPPAGQGMLYNLICSQVLSLILFEANGFHLAPSGTARSGRWIRPSEHGARAGIVPPPVVVGLGLRPNHVVAAAESSEGAEVAEMDFFASDQVAQEQERLRGILKLVSQARVW